MTSDNDDTKPTVRERDLDSPVSLSQGEGAEVVESKNTSGDNEVGCARDLLALGLAGGDEDPEESRWSLALGGVGDESSGAPNMFSARAIDGRYVAGELLGRGGMGEVREVYDSVLDRHIAMKTATLDDPEVLSRFIQEARITSQLQHPNVPPVHDLGMSTDGQHYFTMRRVRGQSLSKLIKKNEAGTLIERLDIFRKICDAVSYAHAGGVIHRDLKPSNIMVGEFGIVLVLDWGLAKILGDTVLPVRVTMSGSMHAVRPEEGDSGSNAGSVGDTSTSSDNGSHETRFGAVMGTPAWMSPEQALGDTEAIGRASDIFGLGAILYALLTGRPPYERKSGETPDETSTWQVVAPSKLSDARDVPRELDAVVLKAMARLPADRFASVQELRNETQAFLERRPLASAKYSWIDHLSKWVSRHKAAVSAAMAVGVVALAVFAFGLWRYTSDVNEARDKAVAESERSKAAERDALISLSDAKVATADALVREGQVSGAHTELVEARSLFRTLERSLLPVDLRLADISGRFVIPMRRWDAGAVAALALRPDDRQALISTAEGRATVWDLPTGVESYSYDPDGEKGKGKVVAIGWMDDEARALLLEGNTLRLIAVESGDQVGQIEDVQLGYNRLTLLGGERVLIVYGMHGGDYKTWLPGDAAFRPVNWPNTFAAASILDREHLAGRRGIRDPTIEIRNIESGEVTWRQEGWTRVGVSGSAALLGNMEGQDFILMDLEGNRIRWTARQSNVERLLLSSDASRALTITGNGQIHAWRSDDGSSIAGLAGNAETRMRGPVQVSHNGERVLGVMQDGQVALWHIGSQARWTGFAPPSTASSIAISHDGQFVVAACDGGEVLLFDAVANQILAQVKITGEARDVDLSPDGRHAAVASSDGQVWLWDLQTGKVAPGFQADEERGTSVAFLLGGKALAAVGTSGVLEIRSFPKLERMHRIENAHKGVIWTVTPSPDGRRLATTGRSEQDGSVRIWDATSGKLLHSRDREENGTVPYGAAWSVDGQEVATVRQSGALVVWNLAKDSVRVVQAHGGPGMEVAFSPDGTMIATTGYDGAVVFMDAETLGPLASFPRHLEPGLDAVFSADGSTFATAASGKQIQIWNLRGHETQPALMKAIETDLRESSEGHEVLARFARLAVATEYWDDAAQLWQEVRDAGGKPAPIDLVRALSMAGLHADAMEFLNSLEPEARANVGLRGWRLWLEDAGR